MTDDTRHETTTRNSGYERQDLQVSGILYFLLAIVVGAAICMVGLRGLFAFLDHREKASQPQVNPLLTNLPADTRHIVSGYPQSVFPNPKLEEDERGQLNDIRTNEEKVLYSYGWVDEKSGTMHIPIERAMDLIVKRGLPVRATGDTVAAKPAMTKKDEKK
jgi:hypothetical protein